MEVTKCISNRLEKVSLIDTYAIDGIEIDFVCFLYKGKEPVYYSFLSGDTYKAICNGLTYLIVQKTTEQIIKKDSYTIPNKKNISIGTKKSYIKLKLLKIIK